jgi:hypothetical protein
LLPFFLLCMFLFQSVFYSCTMPFHSNNISNSPAVALPTKTPACFVVVVLVWCCFVVLMLCCCVVVVLLFCCCVVMLLLFCCWWVFCCWCFVVVFLLLVFCCCFVVVRCCFECITAYVPRSCPQKFLHELFRTVH